MCNIVQLNKNDNILIQSIESNVVYHQLCTLYHFAGPIFPEATILTPLDSVGMRSKA